MTTYKTWAKRAVIADIVALSCAGLFGSNWSSTPVAALLVFMTADILSIRYRPVMFLMILLRLGNVLDAMSFVSDRPVYVAPAALLVASVIFGSIALRSGLRGVVASTPRCPDCSARVKVGSLRCKACGADVPA